MGTAFLRYFKIYIINKRESQGFAEFLSLKGKKNKNQKILKNKNQKILKTH